MGLIGIRLKCLLTYVAGRHTLALAPKRVTLRWVQRSKHLRPELFVKAELDQLQKFRLQEGDILPVVFQRLCCFPCELRREAGRVKGCVKDIVQRGEDLGVQLIKADDALLRATDLGWGIYALRKLLIRWRAMLKCGVKVRVAKIQKPFAQRSMSLS